MKNSDYWKLRFEQLEAASNKNAISAFDTIQEQYIAAEKEIERQISTWYQRFAKNNQITMAEAKKLLTTGELAEFKWDVKEFIKYGEQNALNPQWMKELENASARFHISRLEALKIETQQTVERLFGGQTDAVDKLLKKNYLQNYYHTVYEIQKGFNLGWDIAAIDDRTVERLISKPWATDAKNFSDRIWSNKTSLINEVQTQLTRTFMLGKSPDDAIKAIAAKMKTSQGQAGRLVMTESAYFSSQSQKDAFNALDVERYEIVATLDSRTSAICQDLDGHVFEMKDFEPGVTAPPFHPWCRTTTVPYFDDNFTERAARGSDGKTYYVDSKLNYKDWKKTFVDGGDKSGLKSVDKSDIIKSTTPKVDRKKLELSNFPSEFTAKSEVKNTQAFVDYINDCEGADPNVVNLYGSMGKLDNISSNGIPFKISHAKDHAVQTTVSSYTGELKEVKLVIPKLDGDNLAGQINTMLHEEMHLMDLYCRSDVTKASKWFSTQSDDLKKALVSSRTGMSDEISELFKKFNKQCNDIHDAAYKAYTVKAGEVRKVYEANKTLASWKQYEKERKALWNSMLEDIDYQQRNALGGGVNALQDIYDALSQGSYRDQGIIKYGHGSKYYRSVESQLHETVANYGALSVLRPDLVDMLKSDKPELVEQLNELIKGMLGKVGD